MLFSFEKNLYKKKSAKFPPLFSRILYVRLQCDRLGDFFTFNHVNHQHPKQYEVLKRALNFIRSLLPLGTFERRPRNMTTGQGRERCDRPSTYAYEIFIKSIQVSMQVHVLIGRNPDRNHGKNLTFFPYNLNSRYVIQRKNLKIRIDEPFDQLDISRFLEDLERNEFLSLRSDDRLTSTD